MFGILTIDMTRCQGRDGIALGSAVLARECIDCMRRTWPASDHLSWMEPPKQSPCPERIDPGWWGEDAE